MGVRVQISAAPETKAERLLSVHDGHRMRGTVVND